MSRCGTVAEYQQHLRRGEQPCPECRAASNQYHRTHRATSIDQRRYDRLQVNAYNRAARRLRQAHRKEFDRYYAAERRQAGLDQ